LESVLPKWRGLIEQLPPMHSAVKLNGQPLYAYARRGEEVERRPRTVHIGLLEVTHIEGATATLKVECSGGTYIRTLAHDIGMALGCGAFLTGLVRTGVGRFSLEEARPVDETSSENLLSLRDALEPMPTLALSDEEAGFAQDGRELHLQPDLAPPGPLVSLLNSKGDILGVGRVSGHSVHPECVLPREVTVGI
jgi:tRNA pseudouridine55 synthase